MTTYPTPPGGVPPQTQLLSRRAIFTDAYVVIPKVVMTDIVTTRWPHWTGARAWVLARPMTGFAETFSQALVELEPGGASEAPEPDPGAEGVIFVTRNGVSLEVEGKEHLMQEGGYAYLPPGCKWKIWNRSARPSNFVWIRKAYQFVEGIAPPAAFVTNEKDVEMEAMPQSHGLWGTKRFVESGDLSHDMHVNIVQFEPGGVIAFAETHVMEHGLYVIEGKGVYRLNTDWVEVESGDFMWLRAFCPQACYAGGPGRFRYLLYKDVNRHMNLRLGS